MPTNGLIFRYPLDPTGTNRDNLVIEEQHRLSDLEYRFVVPRYAPFFDNDSLIVYDGDTKLPLAKGVHYLVPTLSQEATLRFGQGISDSILIKPNVPSSSVIVTYQVLGGNFQNNVDNIANIYESYMNDNRAVDWMTGVFGKPTHYPPNLHGHYLYDLFGFEVISFVLEQIRQAILMSYSPAWEMLIEALNNRICTKPEIDEGWVSNKLISFEMLQHASKRLNFNSVSIVPETTRIHNGKNVTLRVDATNAEDGDRYYWKIEHITTTQADFTALTGSFTFYQKKSEFTIQTNRLPEFYPERRFRVIFYRGAVDRCKIFDSLELTMNFNGRSTARRLFDALTMDNNDPRLVKSAKCYSVSRRMKNAVRC